MPESVNRSQDAVSLDSSPAMAMTTLYSAAVGPIGNDYYLPLFSRFEDAGRATLSWNWSACLYTINWMIFRRLWGAALVAVGAMLGIALLLVALGLLVFEWPHEVLYQLLLADLALGMFASGLWGNALLYNHCRQAMMTAVADNKTLVQACAQLSLHASTRRRFIRLLLVNAVLLALVAAAYVRLVGFDSSDAPALDAVQAPALAASSAEPAVSSASAASQAASAAVESTEAVSAPHEAAALPAASAASAVPASSPAAVSASAPAAVAASAISAVPGVIAPAAASPTALPTASSALATSAAKPAQPKTAAPVVSNASGPARARSAVPASVHASAAAHPASKAARAASKPAAQAASKPAAKAALAKAPKTTAAKTSQAAKATPTPRIGLYINAGLFANPDNARNALAKLQAAGLPATAQELETSQGTRTRIRVGPIAQRAQAEATVQQIKALNLDAALVKP